jgi:hypothetical protein
MAKVDGSYVSVVGGVSEQVAEQRRSGQHGEQVNMLSDPVHGLVRRHGSTTKDELKLTGVTLNAAYARQYRTFSFYVGGTEYAMIYQGAARTAGNSMPFAFCINKSTGKFLTVSVLGGAAMDPWVNGGVSAVTMVGQFMAMAANNYLPTKTETDLYAASATKGVAQVRLGSYSRTYKLTIKRASTGITYVGVYTTMASSYPTLLSTSDIPATATDYQKQVNDRVYAWNSAQNKWIGDAASDIQPENIAEKLRVSIVGAGLPSINIARLGGTLYFGDTSEVSVDDGGDGTTFRGVLNDLDDTAKLTSVHYPGKLVKISAKGQEPFYMQAIAENPSLPAGSAQAVRWKEGAAQVVTPASVFALGLVQGTTLYLGSAAAIQAATGVQAPTYAPSVCGSSADQGGVPYFFGKQISCLTVFQDRLLVIANGVIFASRVGDYFNWFRTSKLTLTDDDPIEFFALGSEDDVIHHAVTYNKDCFLFGERKQYTIPGRIALTPSSASAAAAASERGTTSAAPVALANLVFYSKSRPAASQIGVSKYTSSVSQFQLGTFQDTPEAYDISEQLGLYLRGKTIEFAAVSKPHTVLLRMDGQDYGLYLYNYQDAQGSQQRTADAWHRWEWDVNVGQIIGITDNQGVVNVFTLRTRPGEVWVACEEFSMDASVSDTPHLDMQRSANAYATGTGFLKKGTYEPAAGAVAGTSDAGSLVFLGTTLANYDQFMTQAFPSNPNPPANVGLSFDAYVDLTPPFTRDQNDVAITNGRLVVNSYRVHVANTGGLQAQLTNLASGDVTQVLNFNGRRVGLPNNLPSTQPISSASLSVPCGRANQEHVIRLQAVRWNPLAITAIEWVGQYFNSVRRV